MAHWDNQQTRTIQAEQRTAFDDGVDAGMQYPGYPLPDFYRKPYHLFTPYQRGFVFGTNLKEYLEDKAT